MTTAGHHSSFVLADNMRAAINMAWEHGGADFQSRFDKSTHSRADEKGGTAGSVTASCKQDGLTFWADKQHRSAGTHLYWPSLNSRCSFSTLTNNMAVKVSHSAAVSNANDCPLGNWQLQILCGVIHQEPSTRG
jgi:hypothetical protein